MGVEDIFDLMNMEDKEREKLLKPLTPSQLKASVSLSSSTKLRVVTGFPVSQPHCLVTRVHGDGEISGINCALTGIACRRA